MNRRGLLLLTPAIVLLVVVFAAPVALMFPTSLRPYIPGQGIGEGWTAENYVKLVTDPFVLRVGARTIGLGFTVTLVTLVAGYPLAYVIARTRSRARPWLVVLVVFPLLLNLVVRSFGWIALLANRGLVNETLLALGVIDAPIRLMFNFTGLLVGLTHIFLPFMILVLAAAIHNIPAELEEASGTLGANRAVTFLTVTLPLSLPGILGGSILVFVLTISALVTPRLLGGPTYQVMSTMIYDQFVQLLDWPGGSAMAMALTAIVLLMIGFSSLLAARYRVRG
ncbi:MAG TPA: ABC transporter permease [Thermodesulfobacteriota bacterium]